MRLGKRIFCILAVLIALLIDTSVIPFSGLNTAYCPRLCLAVVLTIGYLAGKTQGIIYGTLAGVLLGFTVYTPAGYTMLLYVVCGLAAGFFGRITPPLLLTVVPALASLLLYELIYAVYFYFSSGVLPASLLGGAAARVVIGFVLAQIIYFPFSRVLAPRRKPVSRYPVSEAVK